MANVKHSAATDEHYTPVDIVEAARRTLSTIALDPASCKNANRVVQANRYFDNSMIRDGVFRRYIKDGLTAEWFYAGQTGTVFLNPPGGKVGNQSLPKLFWERLCKEYLDGGVTSAVFIGFSIEMLQTTQSSPFPMSNALVCIPKKRIRFRKPDGSLGASPTHASAIAYLGVSSARFRENFLPLGAIVQPC